MAEFKVFIPSAGLGSRVATVNPKFNKAMLEIANKPVISHIIEKFDPSVPIVVAIGYQGDLLHQYLTLAHPDRNIEFVWIDPYEGPGSGLGITLRQCQHILQCPFIFISNDTVVMDEIPTFDKLPDNWLGYAKVDEASIYRTVKVEDNGQITEMYEKGFNSKRPAYIGVAGIWDYEKFWQYMQHDRAIGVGESHAIYRMILDKKKFTGFKFDWIDTGSLAGIEQAKERLPGKGFSILEKPSEAIWFVGDKVIKYSEDPIFIANRVKRIKRLDRFVPELIGTTTNMYSYKFIEGQIFSSVNSTESFRFLLDFLNRFWTHGPSVKNGWDIMIRPGVPDSYFYKFYITKTIDRVMQYQGRFQSHDHGFEIINGKKYPSTLELLSSINLEKYDEPYIVRFHGDLHFENILLREELNGLPVVLLDWRQDFEGNIEWGDIYYDLAKLKHGLQISHELINKNFYSVERKGNEVKFSYYRKSNHIEYEKILDDYIKSNAIVLGGLDLDKVNLLNALIFLNIAALHHYPYSHFLYYLGKSMLGDLLDDNLRDTV